MPSDGSVFLFLRLFPWLHLCSRLPGDAVPVGSFFFRFLFFFLFLFYFFFSFLFFAGFYDVLIFPFPSPGKWRSRLRGNTVILQGTSER